ncbi:hypothetical protein LEMLEM_LOCUS7966, partial [Lemmus lemmus]
MRRNRNTRQTSTYASKERSLLCKVRDMWAPLTRQAVWHLIDNRQRKNARLYMQH